MDPRRHARRLVAAWITLTFTWSQPNWICERALLALQRVAWLGFQSIGLALFRTITQKALRICTYTSLENLGFAVPK
jgi:hypothetical protein